MQTFGERVALRRVWTIKDLEAGLTTYCKDCHVGGTQAIQNRAQAVYLNSGNSECGSCYGIGFTGGFEPTVFITYMLAADGSETWQQRRSGTMETDRPTVQFPSEPALESGDLVVRYHSWIDDETPGLEEQRYTIEGPVNHPTVRTGLGRDDPTIYISQECSLANLPSSHKFYDVSMGF